MRLRPNAGDLASLTSKLKTLILCLGKVLHVLVIKRLSSFYYLTQPRKCIYIAKYFPAWPRPLQLEARRNFQLIWIEIFCWRSFGLWWRQLPTIFQVHTDPLSFSLALFQNALKYYSEGEWLNQRNLMKLLPLILQITIQTLYPSFKP